MCYNREERRGERKTSHSAARLLSQGHKRKSLFLSLSPPLYGSIRLSRSLSLCVHPSLSISLYLFSSSEEKPLAPERSLSGRPLLTRSLAFASLASSGLTSALTAKGWSSGRSLARASRSGGDASLFFVVDELVLLSREEKKRR